MVLCTCTLLVVMTTELLDDRQTKLQREVVDARHGVNFVMVSDCDGGVCR